MKQKVEQKIIDRFSKDTEILSIAKQIHDEILAECGHPVKETMIPRIISTIWHEFISSNSWEIVKEFNNPKVDYRLLRDLLVEKIKVTLPNIFD